MKAIVPKKLEKNEVFYFMNGKRMSKPYEVTATSPIYSLESALENIKKFELYCSQDKMEFMATMEGTISVEIAKQLAERGYNVEYYLYDSIFPSCFIKQAPNKKGDIFYYMPKKAKRE